MAVKKFNTRVKNKLDTITNWSSSSTTPLSGEIVIGSRNASNTDGSPFIMKIGDGSSTWSALPALAPGTFIGSTSTVSDSNEVDRISVTLDSDSRAYSIAKLATTNDEIQISITASNPLLTDHYILIDNTASVRDKRITSIGITVNETSMSSSNMYIQPEYISAGDIVEIKLSFFKIGNTLKCAITFTSGISNGGEVY